MRHTTALPIATHQSGAHATLVISQRLPPQALLEKSFVLCPPVSCRRLEGKEFTTEDHANSPRRTFMHRTVIQMLVCATDHGLSASWHAHRSQYTSWLTFASSSLEKSKRFHFVNQYSLFLCTCGKSERGIP